MRVVIAGAHGRVARRLAGLLCARGDTVVGIVRTAEAEEELLAEGLETVVLDLEHATVDDLAAVVVDADAVVFAAGSGPGGGTHRYTADRAAAVLLSDAAEQAAVRGYLLMSSMGVEAVTDGRTPEGEDETVVDYLRAKLAAEDGVRNRPAVDMTVLRPGRLTESPGTGLVAVGRGLPPGEISRDDVARVMVALLDAPRPGEVLEVVSGSTPIAEALAGTG
ncbi:SDR family oxidoreductase [Blastococcus jejuensis]|uniref:SDR family oxidoreductase n=1 Tax=Blastococcus jejuensis TaxID=351224 RepID=A0ABP6NUV5_9ACTN